MTADSSQLLVVLSMQSSTELQSKQPDCSTDISEAEAEDIQEIREWLADNPHINACEDQLNLVFFLRGCKHDLDKTKDKIRRFYMMRAERTEWFVDRDPFLPKMQELLEIGVFLPLLVKDDSNRHIFVIRTSAHNPKIHHMNDVFKISKMILDLALRLHPEISTQGLVAIFDMHGATLSHALQLNPALIKRSVESWLIYPCKPKLLEFVNAPMHVNVVLNTFRFFMPAKMKSRLFVRKGAPTIKAALPRELGGAGKSYNELTKFWKEKVEENVEFFKYDEKFRTQIP